VKQIRVPDARRTGAGMPPHGLRAVRVAVPRTLGTRVAEVGPNRLSGSTSGRDAKSTEGSEEIQTPQEGPGGACGRGVEVTDLQPTADSSGLQARSGPRRGTLSAAMYPDPSLITVSVISRWD
jgi:hypothetical protein